jgi:hypothetical protein
MRHSRFLRQAFKLIEFLDERARTGMKGATASVSETSALCGGGADN